MPTGVRPGRSAPKSKTRELVETVITAGLLAAFIMIFIARAFQVDGTSMVPSLLQGERLLVEKVTYRFRPPQRGEIIVFDPGNGQQHYIKRVIGVPGDVVEIDDSRLTINDEDVTENYINGRMLGDFGPVAVPEGHYFVLGDNRNVSVDSRNPRVGMVPRKRIVGRALLRFWPIQRAGILMAPDVALAAD